MPYKDKEIKVLYDKLRYRNNREKIKNNVKNYRINHKEWKAQYDKNYRVRRYRSDPDYRLRDNLRSRINFALENNTKTARTMELIGCSIEQLKGHLQQTAIKNGYKDFDINNYSGQEYAIHHIVPCHMFNLKCSYHQRLCFNWNNQEILSIDDHKKKHEKCN